MNWPGWKLSSARSVHVVFGKTGGKVAFNPFEKKSLQTVTQEEKKPESLEVKEEVIKLPFKQDVIAEPIIRKVSSGMDSPKNKILQQYGGNESDIPINSPYWSMK